SNTSGNSSGCSNSSSSSSRERRRYLKKDAAVEILNERTPQIEGSFKYYIVVDVDRAHNDDDNGDNNQSSNNMRVLKYNDSGVSDSNGDGDGDGDGGKNVNNC
uniref:Uncharacterized protein n=1 Tax=Glossina palpalis gambiensis TaxID=67801 RepID=A0A1B0BF05_9MUSC